MSNTIEIPQEIKTILDTRINELVSNPKVQGILTRMKLDGATTEDVQQLVINTAIGSLFGID